MNRLTDVGAEGCGPLGYHYRYIYDAQNRRVAKYYIYYEEPEAMLQDREAKLYCAAGFRSGGVPAPERTPCATERTEGLEQRSRNPTLEEAIGCRNILDES